MDKKQKFARFGIATKGTVYIIVGILSAMAAFGYGGSAEGSSGVLKYLSKQSYGSIILGLMALGLLGYVFFRFYQTFMNSENEDDDSSGIAKRIGYFVSGVAYALLTYKAAQLALGSGGGGSGGSKKKNMIQNILAQDWGEFAIYALAAILVGKGIYEIYRGYSGKYKEKVQNAGYGSKAENLLLKSGKVGFPARGIVFCILGYMYFSLASGSGTGNSAGTKGALRYIQDEYGAVVMGIVALGLLCYGIFTLIRAKYTKTVI